MNMMDFYAEANLASYLSEYKAAIGARWAPRDDLLCEKLIEAIRSPNHTIRTKRTIIGSLKQEMYNRRYPL